MRHPEKFLQKFSSKKRAIDLCFGVRSIVLDSVLPLLGNLTHLADCFP